MRREALLTWCQSFGQYDEKDEIIWQLILPICGYSAFGGVGGL